jgi:multidrug efflux system membrane fusion protein
VREVEAEPVELEIVVNGRTEASRAVELRAETDGRVIAVGPERGATVAAGEVLLRLDPRERRAMLSQAEATLRQREIEFEAASKLGEKGFQSEIRVAEARAALETAKAQLERIRIELEHTEIKAPFDGILERRPVEIGDFVDVGDPIAMILDQDPYLVVGQVAERDVGRLGVGMPGEARLVTGRTVEGELRYIGSQADPATRTFEVELEVPNRNGRFTAGLTAELRVVYDRTRAHRLPASLLALDEKGRVGVKAVDRNDQVVFHPAEIVRAEGDALWVAGLPERLRVITVGHGFVRAGDEVRPVPEAAAGEPDPRVAERRE